MRAFLATTLLICVSVAFGQNLNDLMTLHALDIDIPENAIRNSLMGRQGGENNLIRISGNSNRRGFGGRQPRFNGGGFANQQPQQNIGFGSGLNSAFGNGAGFGSGNNGGFGSGNNAGVAPRHNSALNQFSQVSSSIGQTQGLTGSVGQQTGFNSGFNSGNNAQQQLPLNRFSSTGGSQHTGGFSGSQTGGNLSGGQQRFGSSVGRNTGNPQGSNNQFQRGFGGQQTSGPRRFRG